MTPGLSVEVLRPLELAADAVNLYGHAAIAAIEQEDELLRIRFKSGSALSWSEGQVLVGQSTQDVFLRRVTKVQSLAPTSVTLATEPARLEELFSTGALRISGSPLAEHAPPSSDPRSALLRTGTDNYNFDPLALLPGGLAALGDACNLEREAGLSVSPQMSLEPYFDIEADFSDEGRHRMQAEVGVRLDASLSIHAHGAAGLNCDAQKQLARIVKRQFFTVPTPAGPVPILFTHRFTPTLQANLQVQVAGEGDFSVGRVMTGSFGVHYRAGQWQPQLEPLHEVGAMNINARVHADFGASGAVGVHLAYQGLFYGIYGPFLELEPRMEAQINGSSPCALEAQADLIVDGIYGFAPKREREDDAVNGCVDASPRWNGRHKHVTGCRCSNEVNKDFDAIFPKHLYRQITGLNRRLEHDVMREWYLNGRCTRGPVSLGRFPEFVDDGRELGYPFLEVPQDDNGTPNDYSDDKSDWTQPVNDAWLRGAIDRRAKIYMATDPCDKEGRAYRDVRDGAPYTPVTAGEIGKLERNGFRIDEASCQWIDPPVIDVEGATVSFEFPEFELNLVKSDDLSLRDDCGDGDSGNNGNDGGGNPGEGGSGEGSDGTDDGGSGDGSTPVGDGAEAAARGLLCLTGQSICCSEGSELNSSGSGCECSEGHQLNATGESCMPACPAGAIANPSGATDCACDAAAGFEIVPGTNTCACDGEAGMRENEAGTACVSANCPSHMPVFDPDLNRCRSREVCVEVKSTSACVFYYSWSSAACWSSVWGEDKFVSNSYSIGEWSALPELTQEADSFYQSCGNGNCSWAQEHCFEGTQMGWVRQVPAVWSGLAPDGTEKTYEHREWQARAAPEHAYAPGILAGYTNVYTGGAAGVTFDFCGPGNGKPITTTLDRTYWCQVQP